MMSRQLTNTVCMIRPANFGANSETASSNAFQNQIREDDPKAISELAQKEFDGFVHQLTKAGVTVYTEMDTALPIKPDAVFPNNWMSTHQNGQVILYPMLSQKRRLERRLDLVENFKNTFRINEVHDLSHFEDQEIFLEGTGSLVLDRINKIAYACLSPRTHPTVLEAFSSISGYQTVVFDAVDGNGLPIYHTNVMMAMGVECVIICMDTIRDAKQKDMLYQHFKDTGKEPLEISLDQMNHFAGNMLQLINQKGQRLMVMSTQAYESLSVPQIEGIEYTSKIVHYPIPTIEKYGGGSARCMIAEIFLPTLNAEWTSFLTE